MKLKKLTAVNIYSYLKLFVDFLDYAGVTTIILGKNLDQKTANAAGKTSILKALYWALWNKELDGATIDSMICRVAGNGMYVVLEFDDRGNEYKITRWKDFKAQKEGPFLHDKTPVNGSGVEFLINGEVFNGESHVQTQKIIEAKLRMTPRLFLSAVLSAQDGTNHFLTANDTDKKELLSELLDLQAYQKAFDNIKKEIKNQEDSLASQEARVENLQEHVQNSSDQIAQMKESEEKYEIEKTETLNRMNFEREVLAKEGRELKDLAMQKDPTKEVREEILALQQSNAALKKETETEQKASEALSSLKTERSLLAPRVQSLTDSLKAKSEEIIKIELEISEEVSFDKEGLLKVSDLIKASVESIKDLSKKISHKKDLKGQRNTLDVTLRSLQKDIEQLDHEISEVKSNAICPSCLRKFQEGESSSLDELLKKIEISKGKKESELSALSTKIQNIDLEIKSLDSVDEDLVKEEANLATMQAKLATLQKEEKDFDLKNQSKRLLSTQIAGLKKEQELMKEEIDRSDKNKASLDKKIINIEELLEKMAPKKKEFEENSLKIQSLQEKLVEGQSLAQRIIDAKRRLQEKIDAFNKNKQESEALAAKANPHTEFIKKLEDQKSSFEARIKKHKDDIIAIQEELKYLNFWKVGFAPTGIRSFITDDVIELLNRKTQENLNDLFDGALSVVFDPESKNNKGVVSNKISTFFVLNGKETPFELLSGGEKRRAILATDLALTEIAEARAGTKLNVRFLDEPFNGIDDNGQIKSLVLFSRLAREKDGFFIISHEEKFQNLCQKALYVVKEREISRLVDRSVFMATDIDRQDQVMEGTDSNNRIQGMLKKKRAQVEDE